MPARADRDRELRRAQRLAHSGARAATSWCRAGIRAGLSVFDFTDSANPVEIAFFDRGPLDAKNLIIGGYWSTYWYNGNIYGSEIARGIDVFRLLPSDYLSQNEIDAATLVRREEFNAQQQPKVTWPATAVVARAYVDQLNRTQGDPARARAQRRAGDGAGGADAIERSQRRARRPNNSPPWPRSSSLTPVAPRCDKKRLTALAETLKARAARLR